MYRGMGRQGQAKMSKSDPGSAIFMEDSEAEVGAQDQKGVLPGRRRHRQRTAARLRSGTRATTPAWSMCA